MQFDDMHSCDRRHLFDRRMQDRYGVSLLKQSPGALQEQDTPLSFPPQLLKHAAKYLCIGSGNTAYDATWQLCLQDRSNGDTGQLLLSRFPVLPSL
jgi:hypothetical protein